MKVGIVGAGAMGSLFGGKLSTNNDVYLIDVWKEHVDKINNFGLTIDEKDTSTVYRPKAFTNSSLVGVCDLVIVFVKSINTYDALVKNKNLIGKETLLMSLQNGYGNTDDLANFTSKENILAGTTSHGCTLKGPGHVYHAGAGPTHIGSLSDSQEKAEIIAKILEQSGFETTVSNNVMELIWSKLFVNAGINPITALLNVKNRFISENSFTRLIVENIAKEAVLIANESGMNFNVEDVTANILNVSEMTGDNNSSMLADVTAKRQTEILKINGAIVKAGKELNINAPYNEVLTNLILAKEATFNI